MSSPRTYILTWAGLVMLLGLTILASFVLRDWQSLTASVSIAFAKAALVFWVFMHLNEEGALVRLFAMAAGAWLLIMAFLTAADYATRSWPG